MQDDRRHIPWFKPTNGHDHSISDAEQYELLEEDIPGYGPRNLGKQPAYEEGGTIDWQREEAAERERKRVLATQRGFRGLVALVVDSCSMWLVIILTGVGIGTAGAWLDVLVRWYARNCVFIISIILSRIFDTQVRRLERR